MILVYPPVAKPSEPPAGIARLAGSLKQHGIPCKVIDANLEGTLSLLRTRPGSCDTWTLRAHRHLSSHLQTLRTPEGYANPDQYRRAVLDINRVLDRSASSDPIRLSLINYSDATLSPLKSNDLLRAAESPEKNPFYLYFRKRLVELLDEGEPKAIGFSLNYLSQALCTFSMIGFLRQEHRRLRIILGGGLVTSWMRRPGWKNPFVGLVDDMVAGPGEEVLLSLLGADHVNGTHAPDYGPFLEHKYFAPGFILPYSASTGCYWHRCSFCPERAEGTPYRTIAPEKAMREAKGMAERSKPAMVHFLDNAMNPALLEQIAYGGFHSPWYGFVRVTHHLADPEFCLALKQSGCVMLKLGLESGDQGVLDQMQKGIDLELASRVLRSLHKAGIGTYVYLLFGTPWETLERARRTLLFTVGHGECIDFLNLAIFNMPVYGPEAERSETRPFYEGDLSLYTNFTHPSGWERPMVRNFLDKEFRRHPVVAAILRRDPPFFTSNHAPFFVKG